MKNNIEVGSIIKGKVTAIKPFGAFVALDEETQGLVHISQVTHGFVKDINDHLSVGQEIEVKVMSVDENSGKISLSIRETQPAPQQQTASKPKRRPEQRKVVSKSFVQAETEGFNTMEDKLKKWLDQSK